MTKFVLIKTPVTEAELLSERIWELAGILGIAAMFFIWLNQLRTRLTLGRSNKGGEAFKFFRSKHHELV